MVVPPIAIYGAIATSKALAQELYGIIDDAFKAREDIKNLRDEYDYNKTVFDIMTGAFQDIGDDLNPVLAPFIVNMTKEVNSKLAQVKIKLEGCRSKWAALRWHFIKDIITEASTALSAWVTRFFQIYIMLPPDLRSKFEKQMVSDRRRTEMDGPLQRLAVHIQLKEASLDFEKEDLEQTLATMTDEPPERRKEDVRSYRYLKDIIRIPDHVRKDAQQLRVFKLEVARLKAVLGAADPGLTHLPKAVSWFQRTVGDDTTPTYYGIAYEVYENQIPEEISLKKVIAMGPPKHSLSDRVKLAQDFVSAMVYLRGLKWVHKAIRSTNVLLCYSSDKKRAPEELGHVNLIGFSVARRNTSEVPSWTRGQENTRFWDDQIYCHPERQTVKMIDEDLREAEEVSKSAPLLHPSGSHAFSDIRTVDAAVTDSVTAPSKGRQLPYYRYMHDIYSIGVVLLEIGLWRDLTPAESPLRTAEPDDRQKILLQTAVDELPRTVGKKYTSIVEACLNADDDGPVVTEVLSGLIQIQV